MEIHDLWHFCQNHKQLLFSQTPKLVKPTRKVCNQHSAKKNSDDEEKLEFQPNM